MSAASSLPRAPWSPAAGSRERRAALAALALSIGAHAAALALLRPGPAPAPAPVPAPIQVALLAPPLAPVVAVPRPTQPAPPREAAPPRPTPVRPSPALLTRSAPAAAPTAITAPPAAAPASPEPAAPPPVAIAPAPVAPPPPAPDPTLLARYGETLSGLLARQQQYPRMAAARGWEGDVVLKLVIARKGNLVHATVVQSSGFPVLDEHALALVAEVQPFPAVPSAVPGGDLEVTVPVHYQLKKKI